jgi:LPS export ABC transporter protein LptC
MKQLQLEHQNKLIYQLKNAIILLVLGGIIAFSYSCDSDIEKVNFPSEKTNFPDQSMTDATILHTKKGRVTLKVTSPKINRFTTVKEPHTIFPDGLHVEQYDSTGAKTSEISANYAIYHENDKLWEAENNVVAINNEGDTLNTEYLIWNEKEELIYTDRYVRIKTEEGIIHGKGFEANQNFTNWEIKETTGTLEVNENE